MNDPAGGPMVAVNFRLPRMEKEMAEAYAEAGGLTLSEWIRIAVEDEFEREKTMALEKAK